MPQISDINQATKREDLSDVLICADARNTPFTSMMRKGKKPANTKFEWPHKKLPDPDTTPIPDGKPADNLRDMSGGRDKLAGRVQKLREVCGVSEMAEEVNTVAGIQSEFAESKANALITVKRAMECVFLSDQDSGIVNGAHQTRGLGKWIQSTAQGDLPVPSDFRTPAANILTVAVSGLTEDAVRAIMKSIWINTGEMMDHDGFIGANIQEALTKMTIHDPNVSGQTVVRTYFTQLKDATLYAKVDVVKGDFGTLRLIPSLWNAWNNTTKAPDHNRAYLLKMDGIQQRANKLPGFKPLPDDDSGPKGLVSSIVGMQVDSPMVHGKIVGS